MPNRKPTPAVVALGKMGFQGHIIPHAWYKTITKETPKRGPKPDLHAIIILSEIVYWYRPKEVRDEQTGELLRWERRFAGDKLQRSYQALADHFGISKGQASAACHRLQEMGLVTLELRNITVRGTNLNNVLFIEPVPERLQEITHPSPQISGEVSSNFGIGMPDFGDTNTKSSVESSTENTTFSGADAPKGNNGPGRSRFNTGPVCNEGAVQPGLVPGSAPEWKGPPPPAVEVWRSWQKNKRHPKKVLWPLIHETVGEGEEDLELWGQIMQKYVAFGWNPVNVENQLQHFRDREIPKMGKGKPNAASERGKTYRQDEKIGPELAAEIRAYRERRAATMEGTSPG